MQDMTPQPEHTSNFVFPVNFTPDFNGFGSSKRHVVAHQRNLASLPFSASYIILAYLRYRSTVCLLSQLLYFLTTATGISKWKSVTIGSMLYLYAYIVDIILHMLSALIFFIFSNQFFISFISSLVNVFFERKEFIDFFSFVKDVFSFFGSSDSEKLSSL